MNGKYTVGMVTSSRKNSGGMEGICFICGEDFIHGLDGDIFAEEFGGGKEGVCCKCAREAWFRLESVYDDAE